MNDSLDKIAAFKQAMERYYQNPLYYRSGLVVSSIVVFLQVWTFLRWFILPHPEMLLYYSITFALSYLVTDFINGLVHMIMDNNTSYASIPGPFIAVFHLHHARPKYTKRHPLKIYFFESGTKFWLVVYLLVLALMQPQLSESLQWFFVAIGVLSSVAELSHYWCHNATSDNPVLLFLQKYGIFLSKKRHLPHHTKDNTHYAFLNGMTNPLLNIIARICFSGYKRHSDLHTRAYIKMQGVGMRK